MRQQCSRCGNIYDSDSMNHIQIVFGPGNRWYSGEPVQDYDYICEVCIGGILSYIKNPGAETLEYEQNILEKAIEMKESGKWSK